LVLDAFQKYDAFQICDALQSSDARQTRSNLTGLRGVTIDSMLKMVSDTAVLSEYCERPASGCEPCHSIDAPHQPDAPHESVMVLHAWRGSQCRVWRYALVYNSTTTAKCGV